MLFLQAFIQMNQDKKGRFINIVNPCCLLPEPSSVDRGRSGSPGMRNVDAQFLMEVPIWKLTLDLAEEERPLGPLGFPLVMNKAEMH